MEQPWPRRARRPLNRRIPRPSVAWPFFFEPGTFPLVQGFNVRSQPRDPSSFTHFSADQKKQLRINTPPR
jgi:hypothetical protein